MKIKSYRQEGDIAIITTNRFLWWGEKEWRGRWLKSLWLTGERYYLSMRDTDGQPMSDRQLVKASQYIKARHLFGDQP
jgi:phage portal protein BeeE